jgi:cytoskeletal protein RodZ
MGEEDLYLSESSEEGSEDEASNRWFLYIMLGLGGLFVCTLGVILVYAFVVAPGANKQYAAQQATVIAHNLSVTAEIAMASQPTTPPPTPPTEPSTPTHTPAPFVTNTPVVVTPTFTPSPSDTPGPTTPTYTPTTTPTATPTQKITPTKKTVTASSLTGTPGATGQLADSGVGGLGLVVMAAGLIAVLFIARRLRLSQQ